MGKPVRFTLLVNGAPSQGAQSAYQFAKAVLNKGHSIFRIFFYRDGVFNACNSKTADQNIIKLWQQLADLHGIELVICVAAAERRGILAELENEGDNCSSLKISGLGQLIEATQISDRVVVFN